MKKHLIPDHSALPRLPYRLFSECWWLEDFCETDKQSARVPDHRHGANAPQREYGEDKACH